MDLIALDLTGCPNARAGDRVELFGEHVALEALARQARTIPYEILVRSAARAPHRVIGRR
jgi:alanine racemase